MPSDYVPSLTNDFISLLAFVFCIVLAAEAALKGEKEN